MILWRQHDCESILGKATPCVLQDVAFQEHPLCILQLENILHDERISVLASHKIRLTQLPAHRPKHVIAAHLNVSRGNRRGAPAEEYVFTSGLQEIVYNLVRPHGIAAASSGDSLGIRAGSRFRNAVKIGKKGIDNRHVLAAA